MGIANCAGRYMAVIILAAAALAFFIPDTGLWVRTGWINYLLMVIMFGMGLTIKLSDFRIVFTRPKDVTIGCLAQFTIMPVAAYLLSMAFGLEKGLMAGVILVGACPGGTASNVITYFSKGDVPLSVGMTAVNTLIAPIVTPLIVFLMLRESVDVDTVSMFVSMAEVVVIPLVLGFLIAYLLPKQTERAKDVLPLVALAAIALTVMCVVSHSKEPLIESGITIFAVVVLHNMIGYCAGYLVARLAGMSEERKRTLSIEVGMQNSGLATSLASSSFPSLELATVPGAIFSVWHNISGSILAGYFSRRKRADGESSPEQ